MKAKRNILAILIVLVIVQESFGQVRERQIDSIYFLFGTLSDYMGRAKYPEMYSRVDIYYEYEKSLSDKIYKSLEKSFTDLEYKSNKDDGYSIYSGELAKIIDVNYIYKPTGSLTMDRDTIYSGKLKHDIFKTDIEKLSFVAGVYVRFGVENDTTYYISVANSASKAQICETLLKELNCTNIRNEILRDYIPVSYNLYFEPSEELKAYFEDVSYLREQIESDIIKYFKEK